MLEKEIEKPILIKDLVKLVIEQDEARSAGRLSLLTKAKSDSLAGILFGSVEDQANLVLFDPVLPPQLKNAKFLAHADIMAELVRLLCWKDASKEIPDAPHDCLIFVEPNIFGFARYEPQANIWYIPGPEGKVDVIPGRVTHFVILINPNQ